MTRNDMGVDMRAGEKEGSVVAAAVGSPAIPAGPGAVPARSATAILALTRDAAARDLLMEIAIHRGYGLCCAVDGAEAIQLLGREPPALIVLDIDTPEGRTLLRALRSEERWRGIPLFALTANNNPMATVAIDAPVFFKPDLNGLEQEVVGRFESAPRVLSTDLEARLPTTPWNRLPPSA